MSWKRFLEPLRSRKVRVAITTAVIAYCAELGLEVPETVVYGILGLGGMIIAGTAIEDAGLKAGGFTNSPEGPKPL